MSFEYERLVEAIADELFESDLAGRPAYVLADASMLEKIAVRAGLDGDPLSVITETVRTALAIDDPDRAPFCELSDATQAHRAQPLETPPALPFLLVLALAAEQMHADDTIAAHNYYSRLHQLLRVSTSRRHRVEEAYRRHAIELWGSLNDWLEAWEGVRGIPTAHSVGGHAFVGLPMSQAVIRRHDRSGLHELFSIEGLAPGTRLSPSDMSEIMDPYATVASTPLSSHLCRLWSVSSTREQIVEAACLELETWDGSGSPFTDPNGPLAATRLLAFLRVFPRKEIEFNLMLPHGSESPDIARFSVAQGEHAMATTSGPGGTTRLVDINAVSATSLIEEALTGSLGDGSCRPIVRRPKRITPLRWDELQGAYVEVERVSLAEECLVLAREDARSRIEDHLAAHSRPGWSELSQLRGMPPGWLVYERVQMISAPTERYHADLTSLIPRARTNLTFRGGFVLPGLLRKWSSLEPPEIVAVAAGASSITVRVHAGTRIDKGAIMIEVDIDDEFMVIPLAEYQLGDGEYFAEMLVDSATRPSATAVLRLRSADSPQFSVDEMDSQLVYSSGSGSAWPLRAVAAEQGRYVNGARQVGLELNPERHAMRAFAPRERPRAGPTLQRVHLGVAMAHDTCLVTGWHYFELPPFLPNQRKTPTVEGECTTCGLVRRFAGTPWAARRRDRDPVREARIVAIPPIAESGEPNFQVAFDALNHVGHGSFVTFERIAAQVEGSGRFADSFLRRQEVVGHIDVARNDWFEVEAWAVNSATLVPIGVECWVLIGSRSLSMVGQLRDLVGENGRVDVTVDAELTRVEVKGVLPAEASLNNVGVTVLGESPSLAIAASLPGLGEVAAGLYRSPVPRYRTAESWDTKSATWRATDSLATPGAYRLKEFGSLYVVRSQDDVESGHVAIGNAQLVKHIANLWANDPLAGYHANSGSVVVPLGADLPGLYGRALSLCSGRAPREVIEYRMLQYSSVSRDVADAVFAKLV